MVRDPVSTFLTARLQCTAFFRGCYLTVYDKVVSPRIAEMFSPGRTTQSDTILKIHFIYFPSPSIKCLLLNNNQAKSSSYKYLLMKMLMLLRCLDDLSSHFLKTIIIISLILLTGTVECTVWSINQSSEGNLAVNVDQLELYKNVVRLTLLLRAGN